MKKVRALEIHELIQAYLDKTYHLFEKEIEESGLAKSNETYGELYYYSVIKLLRYLDIQENDHFLDIGSGLGKLIFQIYLTTDARSVLGIEINPKRYQIGYNVDKIIREQLPEMFSTKSKRSLNLIQGDFLSNTFNTQLNEISIAYVCATVFSAELIEAIGKKLNDINSIQKVASTRKIPNLSEFNLTKKIFVEATWDTVACYIYSRKGQ